MPVTTAAIASDYVCVALLVPIAGVGRVPANKLEVAVGREVGGHRVIGLWERVVSLSGQRVIVLTPEDG